MLSCAMALTMCAGTAVSVSAADPYEERESQYEPKVDLVHNDSFETAELLPLPLLLSNSYPFLRGNFESDEHHTDEHDYYKFSIGGSTGNKGRVAIILSGMATGNNFDLYLYDSNQNLINSSKNLGNTKEILTTPIVTSYTDYYLEVRNESATNNDNSTYNITVEENIVTVTTTVSLSPTTLNASPNEWSTDAYRNMSSIPSDAVVISAKISAKKSTTNNAYNNVLRVKLGNNEYVQVAWASGDIEIPQLIGENCSGYWYAGFKASELSVIVAGKPTYLGIVSMNTFKLTVTYEYDKYFLN